MQPACSLTSILGAEADSILWVTRQRPRLWRCSCLMPPCSLPAISESCQKAQEHGARGSLHRGHPERGHAGGKRGEAEGRQAAAGTEAGAGVVLVGRVQGCWSMGPTRCGAGGGRRWGSRGRQGSGPFEVLGQDNFPA